MGFLQNDSSNIIVDAVLTDIGRQFIARNDGSFSIVKFAAGDDEVDYTLIKKFGQTVGKEKIEKNTPIFEALTNQALAQKYRVISVSNPNLIYLPNLSLAGAGLDSTNNILSIGNTTIKSRTITVEQQTTAAGSIDVELRDQSFIVQVDNRFVQLNGSSPDNIDRDQKAVYIRTKDSTETSVGGSRLTITINAKTISDSQFQIYGARSNKNLINTFVRISGVQSGQVKEFQIQINKTL